MSRADYEARLNELLDVLRNTIREKAIGHDSGEHFMVNADAWMLIRRLVLMNEWTELYRGGDTTRIDWIERTLQPATPATEVFFAGLRSGATDATAFQCEVAPAGSDWHSFQGKTLREAIDAAMTRPAAAVPHPTAPDHD